MITTLFIVLVADDGLIPLTGFVKAFCLGELGQLAHLVSWGLIRPTGSVGSGGASLT